MIIWNAIHIDQDADYVTLTDWTGQRPDYGEVRRRGGFRLSALQWWAIEYETAEVHLGSEGASSQIRFRGYGEQATIELKELADELDEYFERSGRQVAGTNVQVEVLP